MTLVVTPTLGALFTALGNFIQTVLPAGVPVIQMPANRAAMPAAAPGFVGMTAVLQERIMTNLDRWDPAAVMPVAIEIEQAVRLRMQLDCFGAASSDWAVMLSTVLRDEYGCTALAPALSPLYCDAPKFAPLIDGEEQYEHRWIVDAFLQYNPVTSIPMQFADEAAATLIEVDEAYPP